MFANCERSLIGAPGSAGLNIAVRREIEFAIGKQRLLRTKDDFEKDLKKSYNYLDDKNMKFL